jgi:hypothetical protein
MFAAIHQALSRFAPFASEGQWYLLLRITSFEAAFIAFAVVCRRSIISAPRDYCLAATLLAVSTIASFNHSWEEPSDALDLFALTLGVSAAINGRFFICLALSVVFAANRESAAFIGIAWFILASTPRSRVRRLLGAALICFASFSTTVALRAYFGGIENTGNYITPFRNYELIFGAIVRFNILSWLAMLSTAAALLIINVNLKDVKARQFVILAAAFLVPAVLVGLINEIRIFLPCFLMLSFAVAVRPRSDDERWIS